MHFSCSFIFFNASIKLRTKNIQIFLAQRNREKTAEAAIPEKQKSNIPIL